MAGLTCALNCEILPESDYSFSVTFSLMDSDSLAVCKCLHNRLLEADVACVEISTLHAVHTAYLTLLVFLIPSFYLVLVPSDGFCNGLSPSALQAPNGRFSGSHSG